jgi:glutamate racemase
MLGILDSGEGGRLTLKMLRRFYKREDVILLADRERAPYGLLPKRELISTVEDRLGRLISLGARRVIIGCCTASTVWGELSPAVRERSVPIIGATARRALSVLDGGGIALLATRFTVGSDAFDSALQPHGLLKLDAQPLVAMVESGQRDGNADGECLGYISGLVGRAAEGGATVLVLGCTHFPALEQSFSAIGAEAGIRTVVSSVREGVLHALSLTEGEICEGGRDIILSTPL